MISNLGSASSSQTPGRKSSSAVSKVSGLRWLAYGLAQAGASPLARSFRVLNFLRSPLYKMIGFPYGRLPSAGGVSPGFFSYPGEQCENSASSPTSREATASLIAAACSPSSCTTNPTASRTQLRLYESALCAKGLSDIPFHASPPMNDRYPYRSRSIETRCSSSSLRPSDLRRCTA